MRFSYFVISMFIYKETHNCLYSIIRACKSVFQTLITVILTAFPKKYILLVGKNKIAFFYPSHYPVIGGSAVHGYYLAKHLCGKGFILKSFPNLPDGFTQYNKRNVWNICKVILWSDLIYVRIHTEGFTKYIPFIAKILGKSVVAEINGLPDELKLTKNYSDKKILQIDNSLRRWLKYADAIIAVSAMLKNYCIQYLQCRNVFAVENGGEQFLLNNLQVGDDFKTTIDDICRVHKKIAVWSGTSNPWQGIDIIENIASVSDNDVGLIIISNDPYVHSRFEPYQNVYVFDNLNRDEIAYTILHADVGLALYGDHNWCRYNDYYGSSLKYYEYRANGLAVVATPSGHLAHMNHKNVFVSSNIAEIYTWIVHNAVRQEDEKDFRSWSDVADETLQVILKYIK